MRFSRLESGLSIGGGFLASSFAVVSGDVVFALARRRKQQRGWCYRYGRTVVSLIAAVQVAECLATTDWRRDTGQTMSQENVERLREIYEAFNATKQVVIEALTSDVVFIQPDAEVGGEGVYHGREGVVRGVQDLTEIFDDFHVESEKFFDLGDQVLAFVRLRGRGRASGAPIDEPLAHLITFHGELVAEWRVYPNRDEALEAVGLPGEAARLTPKTGS